MAKMERVSIPAPERQTVEMLREAAYSNGSAYATLMLGLWATKQNMAERAICPV